MKCALCDKEIDVTEAQQEAIKCLLANDPDAAALCDECGSRVAADVKQPQ